MNMLFDMSHEKVPVPAGTLRKVPAAGTGTKIKVPAGTHRPGTSPGAPLDFTNFRLHKLQSSDFTTSDFTTLEFITLTSP